MSPPAVVHLSSSSVGTAKTIGGTGDLDGDGNIDVLWHNPTTGVLTVWMMNGLTVRSVQQIDAAHAGTAWELMGTEDFDNDGLVDLLWHDRTSGLVGIWYMSGLRVRSQPFIDWKATGTWRVISR